MHQCSIKTFNKFSSKVEYKKVRDFKEEYFKKAYKKFKKNFSIYADSYNSFLKDSFWLDDYTEFVALKYLNGQKPHNEWDINFDDIINNKLSVKIFDERREYEKFLQFIFYKQWNNVKKYANENGVSIMCDVSICCGDDCIDLYKSNDKSIDYYYNLKKDSYKITHIKRWNTHKEDRFECVINRIKHYGKLYDYIHITDKLYNFISDQNINKNSLSLWTKRALKDFFDIIHKLNFETRVIISDMNTINHLQNDNCVKNSIDLLSSLDVFKFNLNSYNGLILYTSNKYDVALKLVRSKLTRRKGLSIRRRFYDLGVKQKNLMNYLLNIA